jgi:hypothetical protein
MLVAQLSNIRRECINLRSRPLTYSPPLVECWLTRFWRIATFRRFLDRLAMGTLSAPQM